MSAECKGLSDLRELNESEFSLRVNFAYSVSLSMKKSIICHFHFAKFKYTQTYRSTCLQNDPT